MPRRHQALVCQYLENLPSDALADYAEIIRDLVGRQHGVYALYRRGKLCYVGLAINLRRRVRAHLRDRHKGLWDRFSVYLTIDHRHLKELESLVLRIVQPQGNRARGRFARSQNLLPVVKRRVRELRDLELARLGASLVGDLVPRNRARRRKRRPDEAVLAPYVERAMTLRAKHKGTSHKAKVRRDGTIRYNGRVYQSPSLAAKAAVGHAKNGWGFWRYERAPGLWVKLAELRR